MHELLHQRLQSFGFKNRQSLIIRGIEVIQIDYEGFIVLIHPDIEIAQIGIIVDIGRIPLEQWLLKNELYDYGVAVIEKKVHLMGFINISSEEILETYKLTVEVKKMMNRLREILKLQSFKAV